MLQRVRCRKRGAGALERLRDGHDDKGFILNDEDRAPIERRALHQISSGAAKRKLPEAGRSRSFGPRVSRGFDQSSTSQQSEMIDVGGKARVAGAGSVLRGVC